MRSNNLPGGLWGDSRPVYTGPCGSVWPPMWEDVRPRRGEDDPPPLTGTERTRRWEETRYDIDWTPSEMAEALALARLMREDEMANQHGNAIAHRIKRHERYLRQAQAGRELNENRSLTPS